MEEAEDVVDSGRSAMEMAMEMSAEEEEFASYRSDWESRWGADGWGYFCDMSEQTSLNHLCLSCWGN
jgi:hypothetical protein